MLKEQDMFKLFNRRYTEATSAAFFKNFNYGVTPENVHVVYSFTPETSLGDFRNRDIQARCFNHFHALVSFGFSSTGAPFTSPNDRLRCELLQRYKSKLYFYMGADFIMRSSFSNAANPLKTAKRFIEDTAWYYTGQNLFSNEGHDVFFNSCICTKALRDFKALFIRSHGDNFDFNTVANTEFYRECFNTIDEQLEDGKPLNFTGSSLEDIQITRIEEYSFKSDWLHRFSTGLQLTSSPGKKSYDVTFKAKFKDGNETSSTVVLSHVELNNRGDGEIVFILKILLKTLLDFNVYHEKFPSITGIRLLDCNEKLQINKPSTEIGRRILNRAKASRVNPLHVIIETGDSKGSTSSASSEPKTDG